MSGSDTIRKWLARIGWAACPYCGPYDDAECDCGACDVIHPGSHGYDWCVRYGCRMCGDKGRKHPIYEGAE